MSRQNEKILKHKSAGKYSNHWVISRFLRPIDENCVLLGYYPVSSLFLNDVSGQHIGPIFTVQDLYPQNGTDRLSRNVVKKLPLLAA
jgi:hypothetical protein